MQQSMICPTCKSLTPFAQAVRAGPYRPHRVTEQACDAQAQWFNLHQQAMSRLYTGHPTSISPPVVSSRQRFLDPEQAAVFLGGLNSRTVTRWAREGYLPAYPIGEGKRRLWRFLESDLERWMLSRRTGQFSSNPDTAAGTLTSATDAPIRRFVQ
jgi:excisionase family DNA binding protein